MDQNQQFGPYKLDRKIASGGMAEIYLARTGGIQGFEKSLVLKMIHPKWSQDEKFISMLVEEAKLAVTLSHANIAQVFDLGKSGDTYYIAMEYVDGRDLFQVLVRTSELDTYLPFDVAAYITEQVAAALNYAHSRCDSSGENLRIIHRDISPQNIIISLSGEVKLIDFGIAKATMRPGKTQVGIIKGKFFYMSPEQAWGRPLDHRTDVFSLGICLHEMLTGQMLYAEDDQLVLLEKVRAAEIPRPSTIRPGIPPELDEITMKALQKDPNQRFQSAYELQRALAEYLHRRCPGFTPQRAARTMWDLYPQESPKTPDKTKMTNKEFASQRPPDSVIFDLNNVGLPKSAPPKGAPPSGNRSGSQPAHRGRRAPTKPTKVGIAKRTLSPQEDTFMNAERPNNGAVMGGPVRKSHPPPPLADQDNAEAMPEDSTRVVDWEKLQSHLSGQQQKARRASPPPGIKAPPSSSGLRPSPGGLRPSPGRAGRGAPPPIAEEKTAMFTPDLFKSGPAPSSGGLRAAPSGGNADAHERTVMFTPPSPGSLPKAPGGLPRAPGGLPKAPGGVQDMEPHERTVMFTPPTPGSLPGGGGIGQGLPKAPGGPSQAEPHERTMMFDPSKILGGSGPGSRPVPGGSSASSAPMSRPAPATPRPPKPASVPAATEKPLSEMTREEKIAAAKARAAGGNNDLANKIKKKKSGDAPMSREEKIAAAKARAASGNNDLASKIKKKKSGDAGGMSREEKIATAKARAKATSGMSREEKIAAAKAKAAGGGGGMSREEKIAAAKAKAAGGGGDLASKIKKKPKKAPSPDGNDDRAAKIAAAKKRARQKSGKAEPVGKPNKVKSKGNARSNMRVAGRSQILGVDKSTTLGKILSILFSPIFLFLVGAFVIGTPLAGYYVYTKFLAPPPPVQLGSIEVTTTPIGATIEFDGINIADQTPSKIDDVSITEVHTVRVSLDGYVPQEKRGIRVEPGKVQNVDFVLKPVPGSVTLGITPPEDIKVFILKDDGTPGDAPKCVKSPCSIEDLPYAKGTFVRFLIQKEGYKDATETFEWGDTPQISQSVTLEKAE